MKIAHVFTGSCVESEVLSEYGEVYAFGIEPRKHDCMQNVKEYVQCDLRNGLPTDMVFDFMLLHPPCKKFSKANNTNPKEYENLIPTAKEIAENHAKNYAIENVRNSPIGFSPDLRLSGDMFDIPLKYERVFWTNYDIEQPEIANQNAYENTVTQINKQEALSIKSYSNDYHVHSIVRNSLPSAYVHYLMKPLRNRFETIQH
ncbi:hypothetical protein HdyHp2_030 [Haloarcula virus Hardyhisp2]|uniref:Uncharacterized protein n=1 Tax=Haloarcula virus Hardyhisp2 TaxID=2811386 RepID=A0A898KD31_9VIRU|nr:hypothetical protein QIT44_gp06 [Haloarcula virus Hardyhisp2]QSJ05026.1 hypothetical protein HdyHp2_030 [Haloarcula virus Hardyhisp2]